MDSTAQPLQPPHTRASERYTLAAMAIAGDLALTLAQVFPVAVGVLIATLLFNNTIFYWWGAGAVLVVAWIMRPAHRIGGRPIGADEAPHLHAQVAELQRTLQVPGRIELHLDDELNASATETLGFFGLVGTRRVLTIGMPLLATLSADEARAVIAHELGHFSRRHGWLGHWLYRTRDGWLRFASEVRSSDSAFDRAAAEFAKWFVPIFSRRSFPYARACEYEADQDARSCVDGKPLANALARLALVAAIEDDEYAGELEALRRSSPVPPADALQRLAAAIADAPVSRVVAAVSEAMARPARARDTHPSLRERVTALGAHVELAPVETPAGQVLLCDRWARLVAEHNAEWARQAEGAWRMGHHRAASLLPLVGPDTDATRPWTPERRLARIETLREDHDARAEDELQALVREHPGHLRVRFAHLASALTEDAAGATRDLQAFGREQFAFRQAVLSVLLQHAARHGDDEAAGRWRDAMETYAELHERALVACVRKAQDGRGVAATLEPEQRALLAASIATEPCVRRAWLTQASESVLYDVDRPAAELTTQVLALELDPAALERTQGHEDEIAERYRALLRPMVPVEHGALVLVHYTTESVPAYGDPVLLVGRDVK